MLYPVGAYFITFAFKTVFVYVYCLCCLLSWVMPSTLTYQLYMQWFKNLCGRGFSIDVSMINTLPALFFLWLHSGRVSSIYLVSGFCFLSLFVLIISIFSYICSLGFVFVLSVLVSRSYAGALFADACLKGLNGVPDVVECSYVQSSVTELPFFASKVTSIEIPVNASE